jgi:hypothetical protein
MVAGRVADVVGVPGNPDLLYVGTASWGLYESTNGGTTFDPVFETGNTLSIGAIAVQPDRPDVIYVGTGEGAVRNSISFGDGIYKSTDGGRSWAHLGLRETERFSRIAIHPANPHIVVAAAMGRALTGFSVRCRRSKKRVRPQRDSNPCFGLERATSWASGRWGRAEAT